LQSNRLTSLPDSFGDLAALRVLDLMDNKLAALPASFGRMMALTRLHLMYNPLGVFPEVLCDLPRLSDLNLGAAGLRTLPQSLGRMVALERLNLAENCLSELPEAICNLVALDTLNLQNNPMTDAMADRHPARFLLAFLSQHRRLRCACLWREQSELIPACISKLVPQLDSYFDREVWGMPGCLTKLAELRMLEAN